MAKKTVLFNYFEANLIPVIPEMTDEEAIAAHGTAKWDMHELIELIMLHRHTFPLAVAIGDGHCDFELDSCSHDTTANIYGFQLSRLGNYNIPSIKRLGGIPENIDLDDDEFIGYFNSFLYDASFQSFMIQSNKYGLSIKQIEHYLTLLRFAHNNQMSVTETYPCKVSLALIADPAKFQRAMNARYYRQIAIRSSNVIEDAALSNENSTLSDVRRSLLRLTGVNIKLEVSVGSGNPTASLNENELRSILHQFGELPETERPKIEVTIKEDDESNVEVINLVEPRLCDTIRVEMEPRKSIGHEFLYTEMKKLYLDNRRSDIARILGDFTP